MEEEQVTIEQPIPPPAATVQEAPKPITRRRGRPISRAKLRAREKVATMFNEPVSKEPQVVPKRKDRIPFGVPRQSIVTPENDGFKYRVFNDNWSREPDRIQRAADAGYEVVRNVNARGSNEDGSPIEGVLMRIPKELYDQDQALKSKEIDKVDQEIHRGKFQEKSSDKRYIPPDGIKIDTKLIP
jgi:hypothetical protein